MTHFVALLLACLTCGLTLMLAKRGWQIQLGLLMTVLFLSLGAGILLVSLWAIVPLLGLAAFALIRLQAYDARVSQDKAVARICEEGIKRLEDFRDTLPFLTVPEQAFRRVDNYEEAKQTTAKIVERIHRDLRFIDPAADMLIGDGRRFLRNLRMYEGNGQAPSYLFFLHRFDDLVIILEMFRSQADQRSLVRLYRMFGPRIQRRIAGAELEADNE